MAPRLHGGECLIDSARAVWEFVACSAGEDRLLRPKKAARGKLTRKCPSLPPGPLAAGLRHRRLATGRQRRRIGCKALQGAPLAKRHAPAQDFEIIEAKAPDQPRLERRIEPRRGHRSRCRFGGCRRCRRRCHGRLLRLCRGGPGSASPANRRHCASAGRRQLGGVRLQAA